MKYLLAVLSGTAVNLAVTGVEWMAGPAVVLALASLDFIVSDARR